MDQVYEDKLDGKICEEFWNRKHSEYRGQERGLQVRISQKLTLIADSVLCYSSVKPMLGIRDAPAFRIAWN